MGVYNERLNSKQRDLNVCHGLGCSSKNNSEHRSGCSGHTGVTGPGQTRKKPKDLSVRECEERGCGGDGGMYGVCKCDRVG